MSNRLQYKDSSALSSPGLILPKSYRRGFTKDAMMTFDNYTVDSTGVFLIGELERLDQTIHDPLVAVTWGRDIDLREDVTIADEVSSFTNSSFGHPGGIYPSGKNWISKEADNISGPSIDIGKTVNPLYLWGSELRYTIPELESSMKVGRPIDASKYQAMQMKYQMDIDEQVYIGDSFFNTAGLLTNAAVTKTNAPATGTGSSALWINKTPAQILIDVNALLTSTYAASGYSIVPSELRLPPVQFSYLVSQTVSTAGNVSILEFLRNNSMSNAANGRPLNIQPLKWLTGRGTAGVDRAFVYTKDSNRVRFPLVPLQRTPMQYRSIWQIVTYFGRLGVVEFVYPETMAYLDGI